jgi:hypothetical protein
MGFPDELRLHRIPKMRICQRYSFGQMVGGDKVVDVRQEAKLNKKGLQVVRA